MLIFKKKIKARDLNIFLVENVKNLKLFVSVYPPIAAIWFAICKDKVLSGVTVWSIRVKKIFTSGFWDLSTINVIAASYIIILIIWIAAYYRFVTNEKQANSKSNETLKNAIFRSPSPMIYEQYKSFIEDIVKELNLIDGTIDSYKAKFQNILKIICELTSNYVNQKSKETIYGANIMLYFSTNKHEGLLREFKKKTDEWIHFRNRDFDNIIGVLFFDNPLTYKTPEKGETVVAATTKALSLPIIYDTDVKNQRDVNLPGAPFAAFTGEFFFQNVKERDGYKHLAKADIDKVINYWETDLPKVHSIFSISIPYDWKDPDEELDIIGVLNIDCTTGNIVGSENAYNSTFVSLMYPIVCLISKELKNYYDLYIEALKVSGIYPKPMITNPLPANLPGDPLVSNSNGTATTTENEVDAGK